MSWRVSVRRSAVAAVAVALLAALPACAYFNTLYNAKKLYAEAEEARAIRGDVDRATRDKYREVVVKCSKVVQNHPDSRWVDDAIFLMGQALVRQGEHDNGIRKFVELTTNFPNSKYVPPSIYWLALSYYMKGDNAKAQLHAQRFLETYPRHDLHVDALFLAGDISLALDDHDAALGFYERIAAHPKAGRRANEAAIRSADLLYRREEWAAAAEAYKQVLGKGMEWKMRYDVTLALADCYARIERCEEARDLYDELLPSVTVVRERPPVVLGRAASYMCMDSVEVAVSVYRDVIRNFPRSDFAAEAYYRLGEIYHEHFDSLQQAQEAFSKVGSESAASPFASRALQKAGSLKGLIELQTDAGEEEDDERRAERRFLAAEIQFATLRDARLALAGYRAVVDSFPATSYAPRAAYAEAWIIANRLDDAERAIESYRSLVARYPSSPQARGAIEQLGILGAQALQAELEAYVDSAAAHAPPPTTPDTTAVEGARAPAVPDSTAGEGVQAAPESTAAEGAPAASAAAPESTAGEAARPPAAPDSTDNRPAGGE